MKALTEIVLPNLQPNYRGKVRDIYFIDQDELLLVASDRLSAFDVVFPQGIPGKGVILTTISNKWFSLISFIPNHLKEIDATLFPKPFCYHADVLQGRAILVRRAQRLDFECVVRGYLMGSAFQEYQKYQTVANVPLPAGLKLGEALPEPIFSPAIKRDKGHDENISFTELTRQIGSELANLLRDKSLSIFYYASQKLAQHNLLLLDTKFEFGFIDNKLSLIDELLTPDSSRYCFYDSWQAALSQGKNPPTSDKQIIRDYLEAMGWNKKPPAPTLPEEIIQKTLTQYKKIQEVILCLSPELP